MRQTMSEKTYQRVDLAIEQLEMALELFLIGGLDSHAGTPVQSRAVRRSVMRITSDKVGRVMVASAVFALFGACAHSGVVKVGPDTYMIANSEWGFTSGGYQTAKAIDEGSKYCASLAREILVLNSTQNDLSFGK